MGQRIGIIGVGELAAAITEGLSIGPAVSCIRLSPRNARVGRGLVSKYSHVEVCPDNQSVVDSADVVVLAVRPDVTREVLEDLFVPPDRLVISAVAGWSCQALRRILGEDVGLVRAVPLPAVRRREGVTAMYPGEPVAEEVFAALGGALVAPSESCLAAMSATTATLSSHVHFLSTVAGWLADHGLESSEAERFVTGLFHGVSNALSDSDVGLSALGSAHETAGGINEQLRENWFDSRNRAELTDALDLIYRRVTMAAESAPTE